ncbi:hypothetical protein [Phaeobacter inhibens]|uniref:hypothetical protein n=1 Tax=Phaeobacter inhibens TaxID=221822 RepID=UPI000C9CF789|nr:hypothetical protein [Phaeobacter inhibens]AUR06989.1 hypothetical protein PhaeoP59_00789 [Phaeobacter inhibens]UWR81039.1 hypothetical protein K4K97_03635 [Phaeobacter inhibens]
MQALLENSWVTGIGGGILSGLIVFFITKWLFSDQSKREVAQKISAANREIIYAIRDGIPDGVTATKSTIVSLRLATARRWAVEPDFLLDDRGIVDELVKEVMDSSFISAKTKKQYCDELHEITRIYGPEQPVNLSAARSEFEKRLQLSNRLLPITSLSMSIMAGMMVAGVTFVADATGDTSGILSDSPIKAPLLLAVVLTSIALVATVLAARVLVRSKASREERDYVEALKSYREYIRRRREGVSISQDK